MRGILICLSPIQVRTIHTFTSLTEKKAYTQWRLGKLVGEKNSRWKQLLFLFFKKGSQLYNNICICYLCMCYNLFFQRNKTQTKEKTKVCKGFNSLPISHCPPQTSSLLYFTPFKEKIPWYGWLNPPKASECAGGKIWHQMDWRTRCLLEIPE